MKEEIVVLLGGRVAEALVLGDISTGASNDIERATKTPRHGRQVRHERIAGPIAYGRTTTRVFIGRDMGHIKNYSEKTAAEIDEEIHTIIV